MKKIYIKRHDQFANKHIYKGYASAWEHFGYEVCFFNDLLEIDDINYEIMCGCADVGFVSSFAEWGFGRTQDWNDPRHYKIIENSNRSYIFVQMNKFPDPWGSHSNFGCFISDESIKRINDIPNAYLWNYMNNLYEGDDFFYKWEKINQVMLAFDSINYKDLKKDECIYDVCFIGGWANNGYHEKRKIMLEHFTELQNLGLKCGIFINKNLTHEQENFILCNSKVALNIHDAFQRVLGLDSNERTFKSLGTTGALVCDNIGQVRRTFPELELYDTPQQMLELIMEFVNKPKSELKEIKNQNRKLIMDEHTYIKRVEQLRGL